MPILGIKFKGDWQLLSWSLGALSHYARSPTILSSLCFETLKPYGENMEEETARTERGQGAQRSDTCEWRNCVVRGSSCPSCPSWKYVDQRGTAQVSSSCIAPTISNESKTKTFIRALSLGVMCYTAIQNYNKSASFKGKSLQELSSMWGPPITTWFPLSLLLFFILSLFILQTFILRLRTQFKTFPPWFCFCLSLLKYLSLFSLEDLPFLPLMWRSDD